MAISRDEVLHVARLARLALTDDEVERLTGELGAILDAVGVVSELDLADVQPTSHPLDLECGPRTLHVRSRSRSVLAERARGRERPLSGYRYGSSSRHPQALRRGALRLLESGELSAAEPAGRIATPSRSETASSTTSWPTTMEGRRTEAALKDVILDEGGRDDGGLPDPGWVRARLRRDGCRAREERRALAPRQDEHRRVRDGLVDRELGAGPLEEPPGPVARAGRFRRRLGRGGHCRLAPWALGSDTGGSIKQPSALCGNVGLRPIGRQRVPATASWRSPPASTRSALSQRPSGTWRSCTRSSRAVIPGTRRDGRAPRSRSACRRATRWPACGSGFRPSSTRRRAPSEGVSEAVRRAVALAEGLGATVEERARSGAPGGTGSPAITSSPWRRRPRTSPATTASAIGPRAEGSSYQETVDRTRDEWFRRRAEAPDHARHLRALGRLLRRVLRPGAEGAHADHRGAPRRSRGSTSSRARRRRPSPSRSARPPILLRCTRATCSRSRPAWPGCRASIPCGLSEGPRSGCS